MAISVSESRLLPSRSERAQYKEEMTNSHSKINVIYPRFVYPYFVEIYSVTEAEFSAKSELTLRSVEV